MQIQEPGRRLCSCAAAEGLQAYSDMRMARAPGPAQTCSLRAGMYVCMGTPTYRMRKDNLLDNLERCAATRNWCVAWCRVRFLQYCSLYCTPTQQPTSLLSLWLRTAMKTHVHSTPTRIAVQQCPCSPAPWRGPRSDLHGAPESDLVRSRSRLISVSLTPLPGRSWTARLSSSDRRRPVTAL